MAAKEPSRDDVYKRMIRNTVELEAYSDQIQKTAEQLAEALKEYRELIS